MNRIFILGAYGQNNIGDDALLEVFLRQFGGAQLVVNSAQPDQTSQRYGVRAVATYWSWPRLRRLRALLASDMLVFGGGSLLKEVEGGPLKRLLYFVRIFALLLFAKLAGRPTAMLGVGIGPLDRPLYRRLARLAANLTDLICVRDTASRDLLRAIGARGPVHVTADPVFTLAAHDERQTTNDERRAACSERGEATSDGPRVVVIPRYSLGAAQQGALAAACDRLVERYGARILLIPFQTGFRDKYDDVPAAHALRCRMQHAQAADVWVAESPRAALDAIGQAELVLSARLHGLIFAAMQGVAAVALSYEVKVESFMAEIGQTWASVPLRDLEAGKLPQALDRAWAGRAELGAAVGAQARAIQARAQANFELAAELAARPRGRRLLTGGALLFASMTIVNAGNYVFNLILGRWLGPAAFADLSLIVTLLLIVTLITAALQTVSARFSAIYAADGDRERLAGLRGWLGRRAWLAGAALLAICAVGAQLWQSFFQTASAWPFLLFGLSLPFYFAQGVDRGVLQGQTRFGSLSLTYQAEMWVRLVAAIALVGLGWAVNGAVAGLVLSIVATWLVGARALRGLRPRAEPGARAATLDGGAQRALIAFAGPVIAALVGQVLINNSDILIVKHFFAAEPAGQYAALALIGRIVFFATASVVAAMFPIVAQKQQKGEPHRHLLGVSLGLVGAVSAGVIGATLLAPDLIVRLLFGAAYLSIAPLLWLYAVATALYALANVVINYRLSAGSGGGSALAVAAGLAQVAGLWLFHGSLREVVLVQVALMGALLGGLLAWDWWLTRRRTKDRGRRTKDEGRRADDNSMMDGATVRYETGDVRQERQATGAVSFLHRRRRSLFFGLGTLLLLLLMWQVARAEPPSVGHPAQRQIKQVLGNLMDSEAEHAAGAYIPGVGGVLELDLLRGPNTVKGKPSYVGTRDWAIYLMQTFGPKLDAIPASETIALSVDFYDFSDVAYRQLVITCRASDAADPAKYTIWLDGKPYAEAAGQVAAAQPQQPAPAAQPQEQAQPAPTAAPQPQQPAPTAAPQQPAVVVAAPAAPTAGPVNLALNLADPQANHGEWVPITGKWVFGEEGYAQTELGKYDLIALLNRPILGDFRFEASVKFLEGEMGAGIVFNAPNADSKKGAQMISYTGKGTYLQWGYFDDGGVFQYKGGGNLSNGGDGKWHTLAVEVTGKTYNVIVDGAAFARNLPLARDPGGRVGLLASTSHVVFKNLKLESK